MIGVRHVDVTTLAGLTVSTMAPARIVRIPGSLRAEAGLYKVYPSINLPTSNPQCTCSEKFQCRPLMLNSELKKMRATTVDRSAVSASISSDGHYAFVEFATMDEANKAFVLNNRTIIGSSIKVSRPKTY